MTSLDPDPDWSDGVMEPYVPDSGGQSVSGVCVCVCVAAPASCCNCPDVRLLLFVSVSGVAQLVAEPSSRPPLSSPHSNPLVCVLSVADGVCFDCPRLARGFLTSPVCSSRGWWWWWWGEENEGRREVTRIRASVRTTRLRDCFVLMLVRCIFHLSSQHSI